MPAETLVYTDGSCKMGGGARGPGGWGFVIKPPKGAAIEGYGSALETLAKVMEFHAVAEALERLPAGSKSTVFSDNQSLVANLDKQLANWQRSDFANVDASIVESARRIATLIDEKHLVIQWKWIRAHNGNLGNERADALAAQGAREAKASVGASK